MVTDNAFRWSVLVALGIIAVSMYGLFGMAVVAAERRAPGAAG